MLKNNIMNSYLNYKLDSVFIITSNYLFKHNTYLYQNIKTDNYFIQILIYDFNDPLNKVKNYFFTLKKILKIAIIRKYSNIMILSDDILFKSDWIVSLNDLINSEINIRKNTFGAIWLESNQKYFTDKQFDEMKYKKYYTHNLININENKYTVTNGKNAIILSKKIFSVLYKYINNKLKSNDISNIESCFSYASSELNLDSYVLYPNIIINMDKIKPLCLEINKLFFEKNNNLVIPNSNFKSSYGKQNTIISDLNDIIKIKFDVDNIILKNISDLKIIELYYDFVAPYIASDLLYNPNYFNVYFNFNEKISKYFDWIFYKYFYDDLICSNQIQSHNDAIIHYIYYGYKELRYICVDEYVYDKNNKDLELNIKVFNEEFYYKSNKKPIDDYGLSIKPIIYYIKYDYEQNHIKTIK